MKKLFLSLSSITALTFATAMAVAQVPDNSFAGLDNGEILSRVISAQTLDLNDDGVFDRALLMDDKGQASLVIFLSKAGGNGVNRPDFIKKNIAESGPMKGQAPSLTAKDGVLEVHSQNTAIGRVEWYQTLKIAYRDGDYRVIGFSRRDRDKVDGGTWSCELDFLNGKGHVIVDGRNKPLSIEPKMLSVYNWSDELPAACRAK